MHVLLYSTDGRMDGWMDGRTDVVKLVYPLYFVENACITVLYGWKDGWMDGWTDRRGEISISSLLCRECMYYCTLRSKPLKIESIYFNCDLFRRILLPL